MSLTGMVALAGSPDEAVALTEGVALGGLLPGREAGSFAYYQVDYPGNKADVRIQLTIGPADPVYAPAMGLKVYGPYEFEATGVAQEDGTREVSYREDDAATLLVQVYNYSRMGVPYDVTVKGLTTGKVAEEKVVAMVEAPSAQPLQDTVWGTVIGNPGGAFEAHTIAYAGDEADVTVEMTFWPTDPSFAGAFGFEVWDPKGDHAATGIAPEADSHGFLWATFASDMAGDYVVQVFNYTEGVFLNYTLTVTP
jgi:hypothetical protein